MRLYGGMELECVTRTHIELNKLWFSYWVNDSRHWLTVKWRECQSQSRPSVTEWVTESMCVTADWTDTHRQCRELHSRSHSLVMQHTSPTWLGRGLSESDTGLLSHIQIHSSLTWTLTRLRNETVLRPKSNPLAHDWTPPSIRYWLNKASDCRQIKILNMNAQSIKFKLTCVNSYMFYTIDTTPWGGCHSCVLSLWFWQVIMPFHS